MTTENQPLVRKSEGKHVFSVDHPILTIDAIGALNAAVVNADAAMVAGHARESAAKLKRQSLEARLASLPANNLAAGDADLEGSLAEALASDPAASLDAEALADATARRVEARRAREAATIERDMIGLAIAKVDEEIAAIGAEIATLKADRVRHWRAFLKAAQPFLIDRFRQGFAALVEESLQAAVDLQSVSIEGVQLLKYTDWRVMRDSGIILERNVPYERWQDNLAEPATGHDKERDPLFHYEYVPDIKSSSPAIDRFRASLSASE